MNFNYTLPRSRVLSKCSLITARISNSSINKETPLYTMRDFALLPDVVQHLLKAQC